MSDVLDLSVDGDLQPILRATLEKVRARSDKTEKQRSLELEIGGLERQLETGEQLRRGLATVLGVLGNPMLARPGRNGDVRNALAAGLEDVESGLDAYQRSVLARYGIAEIRAAAALDDGDRSQPIQPEVVARLESAVAALAKDSADHRAHLERARARKAAADAKAPAALQDLNSAIEQLARATSAEGVARQREAHSAALGELHTTRQVYETWRKRPTTPKEVLDTQLQAVVDAEIAAAEAHPDVVVLARMQDVATRLPADTETKRLLSGLADEVRLRILDGQERRRIQEMADSLSELNAPGGSIARTIQVGVGVQAAVLGELTKARLTAGYGLGLEIKRAPSGGYQARTTHTVSVKGKATAGVSGAARADLAGTGAGERTEWRSYQSIDDLAAAESNRLLTAVVGLGRSDAKAAQKFIKERRALEQRVAGNRAGLHGTLRRDDLLRELPPDRQDLPLGDIVLGHIARTRLVEVAGKGSFGVGGTLVDLGAVGDGVVERGAISAGGELSAGVARQREYKALPYLDDLTGNPDALSIELMGSTSGLQRIGDGTGLESHTATLHYYNSLGDALERIQIIQDKKGPSEDLVDEARGHQARIKVDLERLAAEYDLFLTNQRQPDDAGRAARAAVADLRQGLLAARGVDHGDPVEYIRRLSVQYALLRRLYRTTTAIAADPDATFPTQLDHFHEQLRTPRIELTETQRERIFGDEAATDTTWVSTIGAKLTAGFGGGAVGESGDGTDGLSGVGGLSMSAALTYTRKKTQHAPASHALGLVVDLSAGAPKAGADGVFATGQIDAKLAKRLAAKLLDNDRLSLLPGLESRADEQAVATLAKAIVAAGARRADRLEISYTLVDGQARLVSVAAVDKSGRGLSVDGTIPVTAEVGVAIEAAVKQTRTRVRAVYHADGTLSGLTDAHRLRRPRPGDPDIEWRRFKQGSQRLERIIGALARDDELGKPDAAADLEQVFSAIRRGKLSAEQQSRWKLKREVPDGQGGSIKVPTPGPANELIPWLIALKQAGGDEAAAADAFIDGYLANRPKLLGAATDKTDAHQAVADLFDGVVAAKRAQEDRTADQRFIRRRGMGADQLKRHIANRLGEKYERLERRVERRLGPGDENDRADAASARGLSNLERLTRRLRHAYEIDHDPRTLKLLRDALSLDYAVRKLDDQTEHASPSDRDAMLRDLSKHLDQVFTRHRVYVSDLIDGRLDVKPDGGGLVVKPRVDAENAALLDQRRIASDLAEARRRLGTDGPNGPALEVAEAVTVRKGRRLRHWRASDHDPEKSAAYLRRRTPSRTARLKRRLTTNRSIAEMLEQVLSENARRRELRRRLIRLRRAQRQSERQRS